MTPQKLKALNGYMSGMTKAEAMRNAGYSNSSARTAPELVFNDPDVIKEIERRQERLIKKNELTEDWIVDRLMAIIECSENILEFDEEGNPTINMANMSPAMRAALGGVEIEHIPTPKRGPYDKYKKFPKPQTKIKIKTADKLKAMEMLGNYLGMFKSKVEVTGDKDIISRLYAAREKVNSGGSLEGVSNVNHSNKS